MSPRAKDAAVSGRGKATHCAARAVTAIRAVRPHRFIRHALRCSLLLLVLAACSAGPSPTPTPARLRIAGSTSMSPALTELAAAFQSQNPSVLLEVQGSDTANGLADLRAGRAEIAALSWWDEAKAVPKGVRLVPVARDAIAIIVHPRNPISDVTALQLRALFAGEILDWHALGGEPGEPVIVSREDGSGTRAAFEARVMGDRRVTLNAIVMPTSRAVVDYVASHRLAVGYVTLNAVDSRVAAAPVESLAPTRETLQSGAYYLIRPLYLAINEPPSTHAQAFLDFVAGPAQQAAWARPHSPATAP